MNLFHKKTCVEGGPHKFQSMLLSSKFPARLANLKAGPQYSVDDFKDKVYEIRCEYCGKTPEQLEGKPSCGTSWNGTSWKNVLTPHVAGTDLVINDMIPICIKLGIDYLSWNEELYFVQNSGKLLKIGKTEELVGD